MEFDEYGYSKAKRPLQPTEQKPDPNMTAIRGMPFLSMVNSKQKIGMASKKQKMAPKVVSSQRRKNFDEMLSESIQQTVSSLRLHEMDLEESKTHKTVVASGNIAFPVQKIPYHPNSPVTLDIGMLSPTPVLGP